MKSDHLTKKYVLSIAGGIGKNIMATAIVRELKKKSSTAEIYIHSPYKEVWTNNPHVTKVFFGNVGDKKEMYKIMSSKECTNLLLEPYADTDYAYRRDHLTRIWGKLCGLDIKDVKPEIYIIDKELLDAEIVLADISKRTWGEDSISKPLFLIQTSGGGGGQSFPISWTRDLPMHIAHGVCLKMLEKGYRVMHIRRPDQFPIDGIPALSLPVREIFACIAHSDKRLFIDSMPQHASYALDKKSVVAWVGNTPDVFGYDFHKNILCKTSKSFRHYPRSYTDTYDITGAIDECPYDTNDLFADDDLVKEVLEL